MSIVEAEFKEYEAVYAAPYMPQAYARGRVPFPTLYDHSGTMVVDLPQILPGDRFTPASIRITGQPYSGALRNFAGVAVREATELVNADGAWGTNPGAQHGFILDFGGMRSMVRLLVDGTPFKFSLVLPWQGTDFAPQSLFPASAPGTATPSRSPHGTGSLQVSLRGAESQKLYVQVYGDIALDDFLDGCVLETLVFPSNLRASVADRPAFWTHPGALQGETEIIGLADELSALASGLPSALVPKLTLLSDAPGVIELPDGIGSLLAEKSAAASWAGNPGTGVDLQAGVPGTFPMLFPEPVNDKTWELRSLKLKATPKLAPWILEAITVDPAAGAAPPVDASIRIDARLSAAQPFSISSPTELHGFGLLLAGVGDKEAELSVELLADDRGRPGAGPALATRMLKVAGASAWREALLEKPLNLAAGLGFWMVVKAKSGTAQWKVTPGTDNTSARYTEDGTAWQPYPNMLAALPTPGPIVESPVAKPPVFPPSAALRIFRTPRAEENQARVVVSHSDGATVVEMSLPVSYDAVEVEWLWPDGKFPLLAPAAGGESRRIDLGIRSLSSGTLDIAAATVFFAWKGA